MFISLTLITGRSPLSFFPTRSNELSIFSVIVMAPFLKIFWISWFIKLVPSLWALQSRDQKPYFQKKKFTKKSRLQLSRHFPEKPFQAPKIIFKSPELIGQELLSYGHLLKEKRLKFTFLREPTFQVLVGGSLAPKKT